MAFETKLHIHFLNLTCQANRPKKTVSISSTTFSRMIKPVKAAPKLRFWSQNLQPALMQDNGFDRIGLELIGGILHANVGIAILEVPYLMKTDENVSPVPDAKARHVLAYRGTLRQVLVKPTERL